MSAPTSDDKLYAGLSYAGLACCMLPTIVIFFLKQGESRYIRLNALQALGFGLAVLVVNVVLSILSTIPVIGLVVGLVGMLLSLGFVGYWIYLMIQAFTGKEFRIPGLTDLIEQNLMD